MTSTTPSRLPAAPEKGRGEPRVVLVIHGGVGVLSEKEMAKITLENGQTLKREHFEAGLAEALEAGYKTLKEDKATAHVDAVEAAIRVMEDSELFNAGHGAVLNNDGRAELDASIMEGRMGEWKSGDPEGKRDTRKRAGAVAAVSHIKNPISAARALMEAPDQRQVLLVSEGAEWFAFSRETQERHPGKIEKVSNVYFWTPHRLREIRKAVEAEEKKGKAAGRLGGEGEGDGHFGTVGAVARRGRHLAAGTSTGGLTNKPRGRVGDSPLIGAGTYADDRACGVSCTGTGELFIRHGVAHDVIARMLYAKAPVDQAAQEALDQLPDERRGVGALIALDAEGRPAFAMSKRSNGLYRGYVTETGEIYVILYKEEKPIRMSRGGKESGWQRAKE
jgi:beta-aspartyl-peptidase (threonine type)